ncbi:MAG: hypothetical protein M1820_010259 [Bogoriella megaspora]|nr:MAG: hypothetical protein M1820_010259 [Bogoriella megaspora]
MAASTPIDTRPRSNSTFLTLVPDQSPILSASDRNLLASSPENSDTAREGIPVDSLAVMVEKAREAKAAGVTPPSAMQFLQLGPVHHRRDSAGSTSTDE